VLVGSGVTVGIEVGWAVLGGGWVVAVGVCNGTGTLVGLVVTLAVFVLVLLWCCPACPMTRA
jgi:hypothetical protein